MWIRLLKQQGRLEALLDGEPEWVTWFDSLLSIEGKMLLTSEKCCMSLPYETGGWDWKSGVQRKENLDELATVSGPEWSCDVPSLPYKRWCFWFCCFCSFPMASISSAFSVFLSCPFPYCYLYCAASLTAKWGKIFQAFDYCTTKGQNYKRTEVF